MLYDLSVPVVAANYQFSRQPACCHAAVELMTAAQ